MATHLETTLESFNSIMHKFDNGEGSIGKLINDENLYKNLEAASKELEELLRDLKENPQTICSPIGFLEKKRQNTNLLILITTSLCSTFPNILFLIIVVSWSRFFY